MDFLELGSGKNSFPESVGPRIVQIICDKFLDHMPLEYRDDDMRVFFELELAHWFYVDHFVGNPQFPECKAVGFKDFCMLVFLECEYLKPKVSKCGEMVENFKRQKQYIPTNGGILVDESLEYVLLVQGYYASSNSWGFPKGKVNEEEASVDCAIREVYEETGYSITDKVNSKRSFSRYTNKALTQLFIVHGVEMDFNFRPHVNKEIKKIQWFRIDHLPVDRMDFHNPGKIGMRPNNFYNVVPFTSDILSYVNKEKMKRQKIMRKMAVSPHPSHNTIAPPSLTAQSFTGESFLEMLANSSHPKPVAPTGGLKEPFVLMYTAPKEGVTYANPCTNTMPVTGKLFDSEERLLVQKREEATIGLMKLLNITPK